MEELKRQIDVLDARLEALDQGLDTLWQRIREAEDMMDNIHTITQQCYGLLWSIDKWAWVQLQIKRRMRRWSAQFRKKG